MILCVFNEDEQNSHSYIHIEQNGKRTNGIKYFLRFDIPKIPFGYDKI